MKRFAATCAVMLLAASAFAGTFSSDLPTDPSASVPSDPMAQGGNRAVWFSPPLTLLVMAATPRDG